MEASPQWAGGHFANPQPLRNSFWGAVSGALHISPNASPAAPPPTVAGARVRLDTPPPTGLRVTWFGHSAVLVELDGWRVLTDPVWSDRASPFSWIGPRRWFKPPIALADLPAIDVVVISHDHYDHLDRPTIEAMREWKKTTFVVPLGVGAHLASWGVPEARIVELDWWGRVRISDGHAGAVASAPAAAAATVAATARARSRSCAHPRGTHPGAWSSTTTPSYGRATRSSARGIASTFRVTPGCSRPCARSARASARSTSR
jgi:hypothetical protein